MSGKTSDVLGLELHEAVAPSHQSNFWLLWWQDCRQTRGLHRLYLAQPLPTVAHLRTLLLTCSPLVWLGDA